MKECCENLETKFNPEEWDLARLSDHLGKYVIYKNECYSLIIHKNEWDGHEDAWVVYYAKENPTSFSTQEPLIKVSGNTLHRALINMAIAYFKFKGEKKDDPNYKWKL